MHELVQKLSSKNILHLIHTYVYFNLGSIHFLEMGVGQSNSGEGH